MTNPPQRRVLRSAIPLLAQWQAGTKVILYHPSLSFMENESIQSISFCLDPFGKISSLPKPRTKVGSNMLLISSIELASK